MNQVLHSTFQLKLSIFYFFRFIITTNGTADSVVKNQGTKEL